MKKWLLLAVVGLMSACSKSDIEEVNTSIGAESPTFYASLEGSDETRTYLDANQKMRWTADDRVTIFFGENYNREFAFTGKTGVTSGGFKQISTDDPFYTAEKSSANYAVYPHSVDNILEDGLLAISLPATQSYAEDSFGLNANTMVAVTKTVDDRFLQFKNVCGYLKLNLYGAKVTVKSISLTGNNEEPLAGAATVTPTYGGDPSMAWAASGTTTSLTLDCGDGVKIGATEAEATPFWLVVPPTTFTKGFTVTITDTAGNTFTKSSTSKQTITRNISKNMPAFEVKTTPTGPANNEIWYTSTDGKIVKPYAKDPFGVTIKSNTYENGKGMITFDGDVKTIGEDAFRDCTSLASITLPEGVTTIGDRAFSFCTSLASVTIPEGLTTIGSDLFNGCTSLAKFEGPLVTSDQRCIVIDGALVAFAPAELFEYVIPEGVTTIGEYAFSRCTSLASITLPEGLTTIGKSAFRFCESLKSITLPEGVTTIGRDAFYGCTSLAKFEGPLATSDQRCIVIDGALVAFAPAELFEYVIPEGVTTIGAGAFEHCTSLASITLPEGITEIGQGAFFYCTSLASITLPEGLTTIGNSAFSVCTSLASITLPEGITSIGEYVFSECKSLASITLPKGLTTIGKSAFNRCTSLASITLPEGLTTIESYTFEDCTSLASITLPEGLTTIGSGTFYRCSSLHSVTLPEGVTEIGQAAFYQCTSLASVYCKPTTPPTGGTDMFRNNASGRKIYVPAGSVDAYKAADGWSEYADAIVGYDFEKGEIVEEVVPAEPANNEIWYTSTDGKIVKPYAKDAFGVAIKSNTYENGKGVITFGGDVKMIGERAFQDCESLVSITLPEGVTTIGYGAFRDCTSLASITLPEGLTEIGGYAFFGCSSLASITLPEGLTTIGQWAFAGCESLTSIIIPEGVTTIEYRTFYGCTSLKSITLPESVTTIGSGTFYDCSSLASITIPESVTKIEYSTFQGCTNLASIIIPEGVTTIGQWAFAGCTSLKSITLPEGVTTIGMYVFYGCTSLESVYCKPTTPPAGGTDMFRNNAPGRKIYVPAGSVDAYKAAEYWKEYASDIVAEE